LNTLGDRNFGRIHHGGLGDFGKYEMEFWEGIGNGVEWDRRLRLFLVYFSFLLHLFVLQSNKTLGYRVCREWENSTQTIYGFTDHQNRAY
jgi:hypothetical protein